MSTPLTLLDVIAIVIPEFEIGRPALLKNVPVNKLIQNFTKKGEIMIVEETT